MSILLKFDDFLVFVAECDRSKERMLELLDDRGLAFMFPLLRLQADLNRQLDSDPSPTELYRWLINTIDAQMLQQPGFINILVTRWVLFIFLFFIEINLQSIAFSAMLLCIYNIYTNKPFEYQL